MSAGRKTILRDRGQAIMRSSGDLGASPTRPAGGGGFGGVPLAGAGAPAVAPPKRRRVDSSRDAKHHSPLVTKSGPIAKVRISDIIGGQARQLGVPTERERERERESFATHLSLCVSPSNTRPAAGAAARAMATAAQPVSSAQGRRSNRPRRRRRAAADGNR